MQSSDGQEFWSPGQSLWSLIREHVSTSELPKIYNALGHSLVDRYTEAYQEMQMWQKMLADTQRGGCSRTGTLLSGSGRHRAPLADPPAVKELVRAEVCMLLQTLRERAGRYGRTHNKELLSLYNPETVGYALGHTDRCYSKLSELSDPRSASRLSTQSNTEAEVEAVRENLNIDGIEQVVNRLKSLFIEECEALKQEIKQLQRDIWTNSQQKDLEPAEPTLGDLNELRHAIQKDLTQYPAPYASSLKELKNTHRLESVSSPRPQVFSAPSSRSDHTYWNHTAFIQPRPPTGPPPGRTSNSSKPTGLSSLSKTHRSTAIAEPRKTTPPKHNILTSSSRSSLSPIRRPDSNSSLGNHSPRSTTCTDTSSFARKWQENSPIHKTHLTPHGSINNKRKEGNLSPQMERKQCLGGQGSRNNNIGSSTISPQSTYKGNKDDKSSDCSGERSKASNEPQNMTPGCNLVTSTHGSTKKSLDMSSNKCGMGLANKEMTTAKSSHHEEAVAVLYKPMGHVSSSSSKTVLKVTSSQMHKEKQERTETEYLNRFIQPVPPQRLK
ncbi:coiled-coil domain-containing protein 24 [Periophthalmus magnuspinnatus]|uniref:coiled-coil domain-containing protein 24 n=1 Tax=Periophthalmus magnuspinnatus TaxID=409849 RepID=UPI00243726FB|nr:coiled-coil domain-containing protein 24 [Periophthalmus magnuspinnatus]